MLPLYNKYQCLFLQVKSIVHPALCSKTWNNEKNIILALYIFGKF